MWSGVLTVIDRCKIWKIVGLGVGLDHNLRSLWNLHHIQRSIYCCHG